MVVSSRLFSGLLNVPHCFPVDTKPHLVIYIMLVDQLDPIV